MNDCQPSKKTDYEVIVKCFGSVYLTEMGFIT